MLKKSYNYFKNFFEQVYIKDGQEELFYYTLQLYERIQTVEGTVMEEYVPIKPEMLKELFTVDSFCYRFYEAYQKKVDQLALIQDRQRLFEQKRIVMQQEFYLQDILFKMNPYTALYDNVQDFKNQFPGEKLARKINKKSSN